LTDFAHLQTPIAVRDVVMARDCYDDCIAYLDDQLERLLAELERQGLLDRSLVIITSDHGEGFGTHGAFGHGGNLFLDQIAVPLVILSPGPASNRVVAHPVSLRDLPATVVDELGLADGSPFPGHSLASLWRPTPGQLPVEVTPAFSEIAHASAFQPQAPNGLGGRGFQMSLVALGRHYVRDGIGSEQIYDLTRDPFETVNLAGVAQGDQMVDAFRRMLLSLLTEKPGSSEAESAYLRPYRQWLRSVVEKSPAPRAAVSVLGAGSKKKERD
jgi:arylsulfatase A-like enzyme